MKGYFVRRINFLQGLSIFLLGFSLGVGGLVLSFLCLLAAVGLDALNGWLTRDKEK